MSNSLSDERKSLLVDNFFQLSFRDEETEPDKAFFETITDPLEYHYIAAIYNWDDGAEVLTWIIKSKICDKGTAKMIFWRSQPSYYTAFLNEEEAKWDAGIFKLNKQIIDNFQSGFYNKESIYYEPGKDPAAEETDYVDPKAKWIIPEFMKETSKGEIINFE